MKLWEGKRKPYKKERNFFEKIRNNIKRSEILRRKTKRYKIECNFVKENETIQNGIHLKKDKTG